VGSLTEVPTGLVARVTGRVSSTGILLLNFRNGDDVVGITGPLSISSEGRLTIPLEISLNGRVLFRASGSLERKGDRIEQPAGGDNPLIPTLTRNGGTGYWFQPDWLPGSEILGGFPVQGTSALFKFRLDNNFPGGFGGTGSRQDYLPISPGMYSNTTPKSFQWRLRGNTLILDFTGDMSHEEIEILGYDRRGALNIRSNNGFTGNNGYGIWFGCESGMMPSGLQLLCRQP
jgi:hypothetical protein